MKSIAPAVVISVLVTCAVGALISLDGGASADDAVPVGTACDTPPFHCTTTSSPQPGGGMDAMSIDMDPSSNPANTATSIGSREFCARINENNLLDADEDDVDTLEIDVTTGPEGIPESHPMIAFAYQMLYDPSALTVTANDVHLLLNALEGSSVFNSSSFLPNSDGEFIGSALDISGNGSDEAGAGVLSRLRLRASSDAMPGLHHLFLSEGVHVDPDNHAFASHSLNHAVVAMNSDCPVEQPEPVLPPTAKPGPTISPTPTLPPPSANSGMDAMAIDMDPSSDPTNTATSIGSREFCARINENDLLDADEETVDTLQLDVMTGPEGIPETNPMLRFTSTLLYDQTTLTVTGNDVDYLLGSLNSGFLFDASDAVPDTDGHFVSSGFDLSNATATGPGVLSRSSIATNHGAAPGMYHLIVDPDASGHTDAKTQTHIPQHFDHAVVAVDEPCPLEQPPIPPPPVPANDDFANAETVYPGDRVHGASYLDRTTNATLEEGEPQPCGGIDRTVWYKFSARPYGQVVRITAPEPRFDQVVAAYRGTSLAELSLIDCAVFDDPSASMEVTIPAGQTVYLQVGGRNGADGVVRLDLEDITPHPTPGPPAVTPTPTPLPTGTIPPLVIVDRSPTPTGPPTPTITPAGPPNAGGTPAPNAGHEDILVTLAFATLGIAIAAGWAAFRASAK